MYFISSTCHIHKTLRVLIHAAVCTALPAVAGRLFVQCQMRLSLQERLGDEGIDDIPREHFIFAPPSVAIERFHSPAVLKPGFRSRCVEGFFPPVRIEVFGPGVKTAAGSPCVFYDPAEPAVASCQSAFQIARKRLVIVEGNAFDPQFL